ncbi:toxin VasX [Aquimarina sp. 2201CG5-10]|uniref:toxin VasX n=1 Tax=Aquimarina callyspongiae TaxID=3098150 RepID=UPI002AB393BE|nr:toxin VasX [Aquimarina sp. 2201CG5-10]MDY8138330.1 toxin VasX [Aquimarina sp. 2201CG5-10]
MGGRTRELTLQIEAEGRTFDFSDQALILECRAEPNVKLHFLRFGQLLDEPKESHLQAKVKTDGGQPQKDENGNIILEEVIIAEPRLENFSTVRTGLNQGYIYIIDENKPNEPIEFKIDGYGNFSSVSWESQRGGVPDIRDVDGKTNTNGYYEADHNAIVWAAYSPIQWTKDYYDQMVGDMQKRQDRMIKIEANGFPLGTTQSNSNDISPYNGITTYFSSENRSLCRRIQQKIDIIQRQEERSEENRNENPDHQEPEIMTDMFITLDDPIGNANEISLHLASEIIMHRAIIESMQTGTDVIDIHKRMLRGGQPGRLSGEKEQINAMFSLALTTYQLVYNDEEMIDDYDGGRIGWGRGIYKQKLLDVLGVEERKKQREKVNSFRDDLGTFLNSDSYKEAYLDYVEGSILNIIDGKFTIMQHLRLLVINPHDIDRTLDLKDEYENNHQWDPFIEETLKENEEYSFHAVLNKQVDIDEETIKQSIDLANKFAAFVTASLETYAKYALEDVVKVESYITLKKVPVQGRYKLLVTRLNKINAYGEDLFEVKGYEVRQKLEAKGMALDKSKSIFGRYKGKKDIIRFKTNTPEIVLVETARGKHIFDIPVVQEVEKEITKYREVSSTQPTKMGQRVGKVLDGAPFRGVVALLQILNISAAYKTLSDHDSVKNRMALIGVSAELAAASGYFAKAVFQKRLGQSSLALIGKWALRLEVAGMGITVVMCGWEAIDSYGARDQDAMWAWIGAGAAFSITTAAATSASVAAFLGPIGWIAAGIGVGLVFLAYYLKDSPLEAYFKHFTFSDDVALDKRNGELTWAYNKRFYDSRVLLMGDDNDYMKYTNFKLAAAELTDLIVCANIELTPKKVINQTEEYIPSYSMHSSGTFIKEGDIKEFTSEISFRQFFSDPSQLSYQVFYYQDGIRNGNGVSLNITNEVIRKAGTSESPPKAVVSFEIPDRFLNSDNNNSQILFVCNLDLGEGKYYPNRYDGNERYLGIIGGINQLRSTHLGIGVTKMDHTYSSNVRVNTLNNLKSYNSWVNE